METPVNLSARVREQSANNQRTDCCPFVHFPMDVDGRTAFAADICFVRNCACFSPFQISLRIVRAASLRHLKRLTQTGLLKIRMRNANRAIVVTSVSSILARWLPQIVDIQRLNYANRLRGPRAR
jgi:hypothetical protein